MAGPPLFDMSNATGTARLFVEAMAGPPSFDTLHAMGPVKLVRDICLFVYRSHVVVFC